MKTTAPVSRVTKLVIITAFILYSAYNVVLTALQDFILFISADASALGTSFGIFTLAAVLSRFLSGWILEKIDDAIALILGNLVVTIVLAAYPFAQHIIVIYAIRAIQGFGWALSTVTVLTMIAENTESSRVSVALGYLNVFGSLSLLMFPVLGSWIITIQSLETFRICFLLAFVISGMSTGLSVYAWKSIPPVITHDIPVSGLPDRAMFRPTLSVFLLFISQGVLLSYSPEISILNGIDNPGVFFSVFASAQIIGSALGGFWTETSGYGPVAALGSISVVSGVLLLALFHGAIPYAASAFIVGLGFAIANIALNSYVSVVSTSSEAKGMAMYSAGADTAVATGSFGTAILLALGWGIPSILSVLLLPALASSLFSYFMIDHDACQ
jgi:MFS family permease